MVVLVLVVVVVVVVVCCYHRSYRLCLFVWGLGHIQLLSSFWICDAQTEKSSKKKVNIRNFRLCHISSLIWYMTSEDIKPRKINNKQNEVSLLDLAVRCLAGKQKNLDSILLRPCSLFKICGLLTLS